MFTGSRKQDEGCCVAGELRAAGEHTLMRSVEAPAAPCPSMHKHHQGWLVPMQTCRVVIMRLRASWGGVLKCAAACNVAI